MCGIKKLILAIGAVFISLYSVFSKLKKKSVKIQPVQQRKNLEGFTFQHQVIQRSLDYEQKYEQHFHNLLWFEESAENKIYKDVTMRKVMLTTIAYRKMELQTSEIDKIKKIIKRGNQLLVTPCDSCNIKTIPKKFTAKIININKSELQIELEDSACFRKQEDLNGSIVNVFFLPPTFQLKVMHEAINRITENVHKTKIFPMAYVSIKDVKRKPILKWFNENISKNDEQKAAVDHIVSGTSTTAPFILYGPPGTGKTATIVEAILQILKNESNRVLVCTPSNSAADDIACKLINYEHEFCCKIFLLRQNSANRDTPLPKCLIRFSAAWFVENDSGCSYADQLNAILSSAKIIVSTLGYTVEFIKRNLQFTHLFIDEAAQATEPQCLVPIKYLLKPNGLLVLAGDPMQLGPVLQSPDAKKYGLGLSLMERLMKQCVLYDSVPFKSNYIVTLKKNYRSHEDILDIPNKYFYEAQLQAYAKDAHYSISKTNILCSGKACRAIVFNAVFGNEAQENNSTSYFNNDELFVVQMYIEKLLTKHKELPTDIGIITPYAAQVNKIKTWLKRINSEEIEVGSVECFQGKEKKIIIISTVRGHENQSKKSSLGFVADDKRFNVSLTRAIAKLIVIGNPYCLENYKMWRVYIEKCKEIGSFVHTDVTVERMKKRNGMKKPLRLREKNSNIEELFVKLNIT